MARGTGAARGRLGENLAIARVRRKESQRLWAQRLEMRVGQDGADATLDNALSMCALFSLKRDEAVGRGGAGRCGGVVLEGALQALRRDRPRHGVAGRANRPGFSQGAKRRVFCRALEGPAEGLALNAGDGLRVFYAACWRSMAASSCR